MDKNDIENAYSNTIYVSIGDAKYDYSPKVLKTIVGSCVAIAIYSEVDGFGWLSHIMLPKAINHKSNNFKYADYAISKGIELFKMKGYKMSNLTAKLVGGAKIYFASEDSIIPDIGKENVLICRKLLMENNIKIKAESVLGSFGRTVFFNLKDGSLFVKCFDGTQIVL